MIANQVKIPDPEERPKESNPYKKLNQYLPMLLTTATMAKNSNTETGINLFNPQIGTNKPRS